MSDSIMPVDNNYVDVESGKRDDVKCLAETHNKEDPPGGELENTNENNGGSISCAGDLRYRKRRKTRRGKSKRRKLKPYSKLSWQERRELDDNQSKRANKVRAQMFAHGQPVAPYNTTQFLMDDHNDLQDLDVQLKAVTTNSDRLKSNSSVFQKPSRARDSSLSVDSEDDYFYSSPEDEEEFLTKEFSNAYEDLRVERLQQIPKSQLIQEYMQLEKKVDSLQKNLKRYETSGQINVSEIDKGEVQMDESSHKLQSYQQQVNKLVQENEQLHRELDRVRRYSETKDRAPSVSSSVDSESDSTCSSASSTSSDSSAGETGSANENENKDSVMRTCDTNSAEVE
ncbi:hypothetical protein C0J52_02687 [Blattella germanica]|nr:hypothetical protein C0J52_02687 [Blattella germanica]